MSIKGLNLTTAQILKIAMQQRDEPRDAARELSAWDEPEQDSTSEREARDERRIEDYISRKDGFVSRSED